MAKRGPDQSWREHVLNSLPRMEARPGLTPAPLETNFAAQTPFDGTPQINVHDFDPVDILPAAAQEKVFLLRRRNDETHRLIPDFSQLQDLNIESEKGRQKLKRLTDPAASGGFGLGDADNRVITATKAVAKATAEARRVAELREIRSAQWQAASRTLRNVEDFLRHLPGGTRLEAVEVEPPKLLKSENITDAIERIGRRGRQLSADLHSVRSAPFPSAHAKQRMREMIGILAGRCEPNVAGLVERGDVKIEQLFPKALARADVHNAGPKAAGCAAYFELVDPVGLIAWLFGDALIAALDREIDSEADDKAALDGPERARREAAILSDHLANDRDLAALVWMGQAQGLAVEHADNCSALAILQCRLITIPHAVPSFGSSPEHAFALVGR